METCYTPEETNQKRTNLALGGTYHHKTIPAFDSLAWSI